MSRILISPSVLAADFAHLAREVAAVTAAGADMIHLDVADGHFVPNITFGAAVVAAVRPHTHLPLDVHLMIAPVDAHLKSFADAGADIITIHAEASSHTQRQLAQIRAWGKKAGLALNPATSLHVIDELWHDIDLLLLMSVNPGFGGQAFLPQATQKIARARAAIGQRDIILSVDGGINATTAAQCIAAGANALVAGTAVFGAPNYAQAITALRGNAATPA